MTLAITDGKHKRNPRPQRRGFFVYILLKSCAVERRRGLAAIIGTDIANAKVGPGGKIGNDIND